MSEEYCDHCGQRLPASLVTDEERQLTSYSPGWFEFRFAIAPAMMMQAERFLVLLDQQLARLRQRALKEREKFLSETER